MDVPVEVAQGCEVGSEGLVIGEGLMMSEEAEALVGLVQLFEHQGPEAPGEDLVGQQVTRTAGDPAWPVDGQPAAAALQFVAAERGRTATLDGRLHLQLTEAEMPGMLAAIPNAPVPKDVADLEPRSDHGRRSAGRDIEVI